MKRAQSEYKDGRQAPLFVRRESDEYGDGFDEWDELDLCDNCGRPLYSCRCGLTVTLTVAQWVRLEAYSCTVSAKLRECSADAVACETAPIESDVPSVVSAPNETCSTRTADLAASTAAVKTSTR